MLDDYESGVTVTHLEVYGMCCQSEVHLVNKKLSLLPGIKRITVNLMLRQVTVAHDATLAPERLVKTLNWALLDASIVDQVGDGSMLRRSQNNWLTVLAIICGVLFLISMGVWKRVTCDCDLQWYADPFTYFAIACVVTGAPLLIARALAGIYDRTVNMFMTMTLAVAGAVLLRDFWEAAAIVFFFVLSEWIQRWCVHQTAKQAGGLAGLLPSSVTVDGAGEKPLDQVPGETLQI